MTKETDAEILERYLLAWLERELKSRREVGFDGETAFKLVFRGKGLNRIHLDKHDDVTAESLRQAAFRK